MKQIILLIALLVVWPDADAGADDEARAPVLTLQILGSGGPFGVGRASAGYLLWVDGKSRIMVDAGGGTFQRFHAAGASVPDLAILALSHFHADHSSEVPALLWATENQPLLAGPSGNDMYASMGEYAAGLFGADGVFRAVTDRQGLEFREVDIANPVSELVYDADGVIIRAIAVPHGPVPALGYRVETAETSIVFSTDQNGTSEAFIDFARGADYLVMHVAIPERVETTWHARPSVIGKVAEETGAGHLILSHLSRIAPLAAGDGDGIPDGFEESYRLIDAGYSGPIIIAEDLMKIPLTE